MPSVQSRVPRWRVRGEAHGPWPAAVLPAVPLVGLGSCCSRKLLWYQQQVCQGALGTGRGRNWAQVTEELMGEVQMGGEETAPSSTGGQRGQETGRSMWGSRLVGSQFQSPALLWLQPQPAARGPFPTQPGVNIVSVLAAFPQAVGGECSSQHPGGSSLEGCRSPCSTQAWGGGSMLPSYPGSPAAVHQTAWPPHAQWSLLPDTGTDAQALAPEEHGEGAVHGITALGGTGVLSFY